MMNMMLIREMWNGAPSFKMIPLSNDCPYIEAAYDSQAQQLIVRHRDKLPVFQLFERLDENGSPIPVQGKKIPEGHSPYKLQRIQFDGNVTFKISHVEDITRFMSLFLISSDQEYIDMLFPKLTPEQLEELKAKNQEMIIEDAEIPDADPTATTE